ncbi:MAG: hypothetical protein P8009_01695 [Gammaproteobacteria bacterium]
MRWQRVFGIGAIVLWALAGAAASAGQGLVAGIYPGAARDRQAGDVTVQVYLTHASFKQVSTWYAGKVGAMTESAANSLGYADAGVGNPGRTVGEIGADVEAIRRGHVVMDQSTVVRSLKDMTATKDVGVVCEAMRRNTAKDGSADSAPVAPNEDTSGSADAQAAAMQRQLQQMQAKLDQANRQMLAETTPLDRKIGAMSDLFAGLRYEAMAGLHGHTKQDLLKVYARYKHLETSWYPTVKTANGPESYDRWLLARDRAKLKGEMHAGAAPAQAGAADMQSLSAKIQAAAAAGRMDEVQRLSAQMRQGMVGAQSNAHQGRAAQLKDRWDFWLAFLKDLDAHAYRTRIWINTQPSSWGY